MKIHNQSTRIRRLNKKIQKI